MPVTLCSNPLQKKACGVLRATSSPVAGDEQGWQRLTMEFVAPESADKAATGGQILTLTISRKPKFSYDEPTRGTVWFDDFTLREVK